MIDQGSYNEYRFASIKSLRAALRSFRTLEALGDTTSITIILDLRRAMEPLSVLTKPQRHAIKLHLIEDLPAEEVAKLLRTTERVVYRNVERGLKSMLGFLQDDYKTDKWLPWMFELMRDPLLTTKEIAVKVGKSVRAVEVCMSRYRESEHIPYRASRRPYTHRKSA
jgi:hypothetical protein